MKNMILKAAALAALALGATAQPAAAVTLTTCASVFGSQGCKFSGVVNSQAEADDLEFKYNQANTAFTPNTDIDLNLLSKIDAGNFGNSLSFIQTKQGEPGEIVAATYTNTNWIIRYFAIKAGNESVLFAVTNPGSSFSWNTQRLNNRGMSHIVFFGDQAQNQVPEPATWAMMIGGFGLVGGAMRRRRRATVNFA
jgi:hypothetical protein